MFSFCLRLAKIFRGEKPTQLEVNIPREIEFTYTPSTECCICLENHRSGEIRVLTPCTHVMCSRCMKKYISKNVNTCPICRETFDLQSHINDLGCPSTIEQVAGDSHENHVMAAIRMQESLPARLTIDLIDIRSRCCVSTPSRYLVSALLVSTNMRIKEMNKYISFFDT